MQRLLRVSQLNHVPAAYAPILRLQELLFEQRSQGLIPDTLLQLEHSDVYTMGKRGSAADFIADPMALRAGGAEVAACPRGGETTYHGPGQLVVYPIVSLRDLGCGARAYVEGLEDVMVRTLGRYHISARGRVPGKTGVWVGDRKIGALGVRISRGVASHGVALNVTTDVSRFRHIVPCGTPDKDITTIHRQLAGTQSGAHLEQQQQQHAAAGVPPTAAPLSSAPSLQQVADDFLDAFAAHFGYSEVEWLPDVQQLAEQMGCLEGGSSAGTQFKASLECNVM